ncbi:MAG: PP2C family protein-serine/threonine phosphatase [Planctomycetota bacterium]|nr:PP2C family protein-serine/threonine phosphatase [Planctomycetota bacterium]
MHRSGVILIGTSGTAWRLRRLHASVAAACEEIPEPRPHPVFRTVEELHDDDLATAAAVVVVDEAEPSIELRRILTRVSFDDVVTCIRIGGLPRSDCLRLPEEIGSEALVAAIRAIVHRQVEIDRLRAEVATTARIAEGVQEEITRVDEELQMAAMVQREFLPRELPVVGGTRLAAMWRPAGYVSGDIYDVTRLDEDHIGLFIADAVGHGVPAALLTMVICRSLPTKEIMGEDRYRIVPPAEALERLNQFMVSRQGRSARFATAVYAVYNARTRRVTIASAGHPAVLHLASAEEGGEVREIGSTGGLLGIFEDERYGETTVQLAAGEGLVFHSDGFEQAFPHDLANHEQRRLPNQRYRDVIANLTGEAEPEEMIHGVRSLLDEHDGSLHQPDDLTMICLRADVDTEAIGFDPESANVGCPGSGEVPDRLAG